MHLSAISDTEILIGRKTFFICLPPALLPESYTELLLSKGYEAYDIQSDDVCPLKKKVELIISLFVDSILFFYIDSDAEDVEWESYLKELQETFGDAVSLGVLYEKRGEEAQKKELEERYIRAHALQCGCIPLSDDREQNLELVASVLLQNQAAGRRKTVRALCSPKSTASFDAAQRHFVAPISDISVDHFACVFPQEQKQIPFYEKISGVSLNVEGTPITTDAVLLSQRSSQAGKRYIFTFSHGDGMPGLADDARSSLVATLYTLVTERVVTLMRRVFTAAGKQFRAMNPYA